MKTNLPVLLRGRPATLMIALLLLVLGGGARAAAQVVTNTGDSGPGTLRDAIINATNGATITFATNLSGTTITLSNTLTIKTNLTIDGSALPGGIQINGNASVQVFNVKSNNTVVMNSLTITNGSSSYGAGIYNAGTLTVNQCTLAGNKTSYEDISSGGGIFNAGTLTVNQCTLAGNFAYRGGGIGNIGTLTVSQSSLSGNHANQGGGIQNGGTLTVNQCTLSGNYGEWEGGGIFNGGTLTVNQCTLSGNYGLGGPYYGPVGDPIGNPIFYFGGGGIENFGTLTVNQCTVSGNNIYYGGGGIENFGTLILLNSIVAGNSGVDIYNCYFTNSFPGSVTLEGANIVQSLTNITYFGIGSITGPAPITNAPMLAPLGNYGGPTQTMPPLPGSPAIDACTNGTSFTTDQRGFPRVVGPFADIGAVKFQASPVVINADSGPGSLRYAITYATNGATITFAPNLSGTTITLASTLTINTNLTIDASALPGGIQINGNRSVQIFNVASNNTVVLNSLTITNGCAVGGYGGGIYNAGTLTANQCTLAGNVASGGAGGGIYNAGTLTVNQCTLAGNIEIILENDGRGGGGIYNAGTGTVNECTLSENNAEQEGGGIYNAGTLAVNQCTVVSNNVPGGLGEGGAGGIANYGTLTLLNSIVAGNSSWDIYNYDTLTYGGPNIVQSVVTSYRSTATGPAPINAAPLLAPLGYYGGPTQTMPPLPGSPAIDGCTSGTSFTTDQRGFPRVVGPFADIGAVEFQASPVVTDADSGPGSLRYAIAYATNGATITFAPNLSGATITLSNTLTINTNLTIDASALPGGIQINGNHSVQIFNVATNNTVVLNSLAITNGFVNGNGGGINNHGTLTVYQCTISGNSAGYGGGIWNVGTLTVNQCTLSGNVTHLISGGGDSGGGIHNSGSGTVNQCTLSGNSAYEGGGIENAGTLTVSQCTLSENITHGAMGGDSYGFGGGIFSSVGFSSVTLTVLNSIVAGNSSWDIYNNGTLAYGGPNIVQSVATNHFSTITGPAPINAAPLLAPLGNYGGPTQTMPPLPGSPAIDAGSDAATNTFATDQRGYPRLEGLHVDIGAVELPTIQFTASPTNAPVGLTIQFNCPSVDSDGSAITQWNWNFGDVTASTLQNPTHVYTTVGRFTPGLIVTNSLGLTLSGSGPAIAILSPPAITGISLSGSNLVIAGSNGFSGITYYVLTSTNLALPRDQWTPVATNVWSANGNFSLTVSNTVNPPVPQQFYLFQVQ